MSQLAKFVTQAATVDHRAVVTPVAVVVVALPAPTATGTLEQITSAAKVALAGRRHSTEGQGEQEVTISKTVSPLGLSTLETLEVAVEAAELMRMPAAVPLAA